MNINNLPVTEQELEEYCREASWYHTIRLSEELTTAGAFDHDKYLSYYGFPKSLSGNTVLDVGSSDGFFSFHFESLGSEDVLAVDTNKLDGQLAISPSPSQINAYKDKYERAYAQNSKFTNLANNLGLDQVHHISILRTLLNSNIRFENRSVYDLTKLDTKYDFVFCGDLIEHLKNPIEAVEQLQSVCRDTCIIALSNPLELRAPLSLINFIPKLKDRLLTYHGDGGGSFFHFHPRAFKKLLMASNFKDVEIYSQFNMKHEKYKHSVPHVVFHCKV